jgi:baculoviral IAP repeat-containing protein 6
VALGKELREWQEEKSLIHWDSSVLIRVDEGSVLAWRYAITGPPHTPYANAFLTFDLACPSNYPHASPHSLITSRGGGRVRFGPNLYSNGKVCLSLLGTWAGPGWTPTSTIYQVILSLQALILTRTPLENEPGYGPPSDSTEDTLGYHYLRCITYNFDVRLGTLLVGILQPLQRPPPSFATAAALHFAHKRGEIASQCILWCEEVILYLVFLKGCAGINLDGKLQSVLHNRFAVFEGGEGPHPRVSLASSGGEAWGGPRTLAGLGAELARVKALKNALFPLGGRKGSGSGSGSGGGEGDAVLSPPPPPSTFASADPEHIKEWHSLRQSPPFWTAVSTLRAAEEVLKALGAVAVPPGTQGDGSMPLEEVRKEYRTSTIGSKSMFLRLTKSSEARKEDIGGGWDTSGRHGLAQLSDS